MAKNRNKKTQVLSNQDRGDSYREVFLNVGNAGDPTAYKSAATSRPLMKFQLDRIFMGDGVGRRIVEIVPEEMFRAGFNVEGVDDMKEIRSKWDALNANQMLTDATVWDRLYGGALVVFGLDDGRSFEDEAGEGEVKFIRVYDRYEVSPYLYNEDPNSDAFGEVEYWQVNAQFTGSYYVHRSRCIALRGRRLSNEMRRRQNGWGASALQGVSDALADFGLSHQMATSLLARKQQGVWKIKDLAEMLQDRIGKSLVKERQAEVDMSRSINNSIALDSLTEEYELLNGDLGGVTDVMGEKKSVLMMVTGIHESILTGENVSGINANENTALATFHQLVERAQIEKARPVMEYIIERMIPNQGNWAIQFNPLAVESDQQRAERVAKESEADERYITNQLLDDEEIRDTLRKRGDYVMKDGPAKIRPPETTPEEDEDLINGKNPANPQV